MTHRILIVENDPLWHQMLEEISENLGYATCQASLGTDALHLVRETDVSLILLDIKLPGIKGPEVQRVIVVPGNRFVGVVLGIKKVDFWSRWEAKKINLSL